VNIKTWADFISVSLLVEARITYCRKQIIMSKNKKVMSIAIRPELEEQLRNCSKRKGISTSTYIGNLLEQAVKINPDDDPLVIGKSMDDDIIPVVLKIPANLKLNPEKLRHWMEVQSNGIVKVMTKDIVKES
jgi:hypothetical protein